MKTIRYILSLCLIALTVWTCADDEKNVDFANTATAPANLAIQFDVTQDNTGLVTMLPTAEGAVSFDIAFGDDTPDPVFIAQLCGGDIHCFCNCFWGYRTYV